MPEGDSLHRAARKLQVLVGERVSVETPHPRAAASLAAERIDGRKLEAVEAVGKNLLLTFEGGLVLRSHLRMTGRWQVVERGSARYGKPWLVLAGKEREALLWNGPVLELSARGTRRLGPDILAEPPDLAAMVANLRRAQARQLGDALLDQRIVAGIGNIWKAESLWHARLSPWLPVGEASDEELERVLREAARLMRASVEHWSNGRAVYKRAGRACRRCGEPIRSCGQGDASRTAYWCARCQRGEGRPNA
jgi:endonuclease VIII